MTIKDWQRLGGKAGIQYYTYNQINSRISMFRLIAFLLFGLALIWGIADQFVWAYVISGLFLAAFVTLVIIHPHTLKKQEYFACRQHIIQKYARRIETRYDKFEEDGERYRTDSHPQSKDLDLFGKRSLYQYLCCAYTRMGRDRLAKWLTEPTADREEILSRQQAVKELAEDMEFGFRLQTLGRLFEAKGYEDQQEELDKFLKYVESKEKQTSPFFRVCAWILPVITLLVAGLAVSGLIPIWLAPVGIVLQLLLALPMQKRILSVLGPLLTVQNAVVSYEEMFKEVERASFHSQRLQQLQSRISSASGAKNGIRSLNAVCELVKIRHNPLLYVLGLCLLMWDFHCLAAVDRWREKYGGQLRGWMEAIGELEALISLAVPALALDNHCFPEILESDSPSIHGKNLSHPLLNPEKAVGNCVDLNAQTCIITGSNMSGKTTYLRTIGINALLAFAGGPVCAQELSLSCMRVFTSMRVEDDVSRGISTFYAEILRIRSMVEYSKLKRPMLILIDEIFKGTNSSDRIMGATEAIRRLSTPWAVVVVSTHDFELCALSEDPNIQALNFHFSEYYVNSEIRFDYALKPGRCQTTNARHLLRLAGILETPSQTEPTKF
ncbi:MAG: mannonate oxidoreductase [Clostridiales bacterium]|jgi:hypothetical protein|nr:mannonate oxidoreductase [Clostridiales bacterium]